MRKLLTVLFTMGVLIFTPSWVFASAAEPPQREMTVSEKSQAAGLILGDLMTLIAEEYAGDPRRGPEELYEAALWGMTSILDPYSVYMNEEALGMFSDSLTGRMTGIGVVVRINTEAKPEVLRVMPNTPAQEIGLLKGDVILSVNGKTVDGLDLNEVIALITQSGAEQVTVSVNRGGTDINFIMQKRDLVSITVYTDVFENMLGPEWTDESVPYRYLAVTSVSETTAEDLRTQIAVLQAEGVQGIVLDMRGNQGGYLDVAEDICDQLVPAGPVYHTVDSKGNRNTYESALEKLPFEKVAVLVDDSTASAAELITAALQDTEAAVVIGETTFGKGVVQSMFDLTAGGALKLTTEEYLRRDGSKIDKIGVVPDIVLEMEPNEYETPDDEAMIKALEWLQGE